MGSYVARSTEGKIVEAIFTDLRDRRFLKWMFHDGHAHPVCRLDSGESLMSLDLDVQAEIRRAWRKIIREELANRTPPTRQEDPDQ